jgi:hypothetical protein
MIIDEYVQPTTLTGFVREVPYPAQLILNAYLPDKFVGDIEAAMDQLTRTNRAAKFRAWDSETPTSQRDSFQRSRVKLPPLGVKLPIGEYERLMLERVRTGGDNRDAYVEAIYNDAEQLTREVYNRMEIARGDVLVDGKFTLAGEMDLYIEADFGLPGTHLVSAATAWSDTTNSTPLTNIKTWTDLYMDDSSGQMPGLMLTSRKVVNNLLLNQQIRNLFYRGDAVTGGPSLLTPQQLNTVLNAYGYPPIATYDTKINIDGTDTRVIPDDKVLFLPQDPTSLGYTAWGVTAESLELAAGQNPGLAFNELAGLVGVVLKEGDPLRVWTKVGAVGMPILTNPKMLVVADVM